MKKLGQSDRFHLEAAQGWVELGEWREANEELDRITPQLRVHPDVLCVRWMVCFKADNLELAAEIERVLVAASMMP